MVVGCSYAAAICLVLLVPVPRGAYNARVEYENDPFKISPRVGEGEYPQLPMKFLHSKVHVKFDFGG